MINQIIITVYLMFSVFFFMLVIVCDKQEIINKLNEELEEMGEELKEARDLNKYYELSKGMPKI